MENLDEIIEEEITDSEGEEGGDEPEPTPEPISNMIYFDSEKQAHAEPIEEPLCIVEEEVWQEFATLKLGYDYDVTNEGIIDLRETEERKAEEAAQREDEFNHAFFNTSLGYIRRSVKMANGSHKDFLSDLLPLIKIAVEAGQAVNILTYDKPPFDEDVEDWTEYQHTVVVNAQFIQECILQISADFAPINNEE